jgi:putative ABC transport system permease protein
MVEGIFVEGLIYGIMALGVFFTFRILNFPDLTVDGSFPLGAAVMAACITSGAGVFWGLTLALVSGWLAGAVTAEIHNRLRVPHLLAGILTMTMLYSINIRIMGNRANLPLVRSETLMTLVTQAFPGIDPAWVLLGFFIVLVLGIKVLLDLFFLTDMGLVFGALGNNEQMVLAAGVNPATYKVIGVGISNALVAFSGALAAQYQGFSDVNLGLGMVVFGLAAVMIGEFLIPSNRIWVLTLRVVLGAILYKAILYFGRYYGYAIHMTPSDLKLISGLLIIFALVLTRRGKKGRGGLFS